MRHTIGIRRETIDATERRAPLTPAQVRKLVGDYGTDFVVEPSPLRVFPDDDYAAAGATISTDLSGCNVVFGVKEIPVEQIQPGKAYCFFSHTIKAQSYNMPMLKHIVDVGATLLDYELVATGDEECVLVWRYGFECRGVFRLVQPLVAFVFKRMGTKALTQLAEYMRGHRDRYRGG